MEKELAPVFALLEATVAATRTQVDLAERDAESVLADARRRSRQATEDAQGRVAAEAASAMARELARLDLEADSSAAGAEAECRAIRDAAATSVGALSDKMVDFALALGSGRAASRRTGA